MNQEQFVEQVVKGLVRDTALTVLKKQVARETDNPLYPKPINDAIGWFRMLDDEHKSFVLSIAKIAIHSTIFRALACLDGVHEIDDKDGSLSLYYKTEDGTILALLADPEAECLLHDLYMEDFPSWLADQS